MRIMEDDLRNPAVHALLQLHLAGMHEHSPPGSVHALDLAALRQPNITLFTAWDGDEVTGCGALKELDSTHGEVKSMRTDSAHLRRGVASAILARITETARARGYVRLSLETGTGDAFDAACRLYDRYGFVSCGPFADYGNDPFSRFFTLEL